MGYEPKFWYPSDDTFDDVIIKSRDIVDAALDKAFGVTLKETLLMMIDKNVCEAVQDHVKEGILWVVDSKEPRIEFVAFLGEGKEGEPEYPTYSEGLRTLFEEALDNCEVGGSDESLWKALIKAYDDWKTR